MGFIVNYLGRGLPCLTFVPIRRLHSNRNSCTGLVDDAYVSNSYVDEWYQVGSIRCTETDDGE